MALTRFTHQRAVIGKATIAIATGDPAGIGLEISLKAALDPAVRAACQPVIVSDARLVARHAGACGINAELRVIQRIGDASWSTGAVNVLDCPQPEAATLGFGGTSAAAGVASLAFARAAIKAAMAGEVDAVVAAPQNETSIAQRRHRSSTAIRHSWRARPAPTRTAST